MKKVRKAVIPVAGLGVRFLPVTKAIPKEMLPIIDKPTIQYIVEECLASGIEEILLISSRTKTSIENHFDRSPELEHHLEKSGKMAELKQIKNLANVNITCIRQKEPQGTGQAVGLAKSFVGDEPFAVVYGEDLIKAKELPALKELINEYEKTGGNIVGVQTVKREDVSKYGIIEYEEGNKIKNIVEKPKVEAAPSCDAGLGRYIFNPSIFTEIAALKPSANNEYLLTDAMLALMAKEDFYACKYSGQYYDIGNRLGYIKANIDYALDRDDLKTELSEFLASKKL